jgi:hypothetical protein
MSIRAISQAEGRVLPKTAGRQRSKLLITATATATTTKVQPAARIQAHEASIHRLSHSDASTIGWLAMACRWLLLQKGVSTPLTTCHTHRGGHVAGCSQEMAAAADVVQQLWSFFDRGYGGVDA